MDKLDFTLELNAEGVSNEVEDKLFAQAEQQLERLANGRRDLIGAAITVREVGQYEQAFLFEATVVAYIRPNNIAATKKNEDPTAAFKEAMDAVERQIRKLRARSNRPWEQPDSGRVIQEVAEIVAAEGELTS